MIATLIVSLAIFCISTSASVIPQQPLAPQSSPTWTPNPLPLVIWHGLGDNYKAEGLRSIGDLAQEINPGTFPYYVRLDADPSSDRKATYFGNLTLQVAKVCADLAAHPILSTAPAINAIGFSQGGQFIRAYVERCNKPPVANLITFGAQHNGISKFQNCAATDWVCQGAQALLKGNIWSQFVQNGVVPPQYFRDPADLEAYLEHSNFLADVNNERVSKNETYKQNLLKLEKFVMYLFSDDTVVLPKESSWFSDVNATTGEEIKLKDRPMYKKDWLGLKTLDEQHKLEFKIAEGGHMQLSDKLLEEVFKQYFTPKTKGH
ncbi:hypothetical protein MMC26_007681 [Xylographa opegraphella]|nr:hypothetical protein [Xylographa opegraphella]